MKPRGNALTQTLGLFTSLSTLICCALPALMVSLGAGAALAGVVTAFPQLIWVSEHKLGVFVFAGVMLLLSGVATYRNRNAPCPTDPALAKSCMTLRRIASYIFWISVLIYGTGFTFAFLLA